MSSKTKIEAQPNKFQLLLARIKVAWRHFCKFVRKKFRQFCQFIRFRVLGQRECMAVRHDFCASKKPKVTVLFIHGIAASYESWREAVAMLENDVDTKDIRFVAIDLMGFGHSPRPKDFKYTYAGYREALRYTIKKLHINTPLILAGHSMGCLISMDYALAHPKDVAKMVLVSPPIFRKAEIGSITDKLYHVTYSKISEITDKELIDKMGNLINFISGFDQKTLESPAFHGGIENIILNNDNYKRFFSLRKPIKVIHGRFDPFISGENLRAIAARNKSIDLITTNGKHSIDGTKRDRIVKIIKEECLNI